jgi:nicotinate-nucleotide adenylyltransferase
MIGLMGGTFNPIHYGHLRPALEVAEKLGLDEVRFIPASQPPLRDVPSVSARHRLNMVELAIQNESRFVLDDRELRRESLSYTVDTLLSLREEFGNTMPLVWMMGMDAYQRFTQWHQWEKILQLAHLLVSHRPNYHSDENLSENNLLTGYHAPRLSLLSDAAAGRIHFMPVTQLDISATLIRENLRKHQSIRYLLPDAVCDYITEKRLYR